MKSAHYLLLTHTVSDGDLSLKTSSRRPAQVEFGPSDGLSGGTSRLTDTRPPESGPVSPGRSTEGGLYSPNVSTSGPTIGALVLSSPRDPDGLQADKETRQGPDLNTEC